MFSTKKFVVDDDEYEWEGGSKKGETIIETEGDEAEVDKLTSPFPLL